MTLVEFAEFELAEECRYYNALTVLWKEVWTVLCMEVCGGRSMAEFAEVVAWKWHGAYRVV